MSWLQSVFNGNSPGLTLTLIVVSLAVALVLLFWIFRKIAGGNQIKAGRGRQPRLSVTDAAVVDDKRRLVLVRRDNVEHLIMIGGPTDVVIEQRIPMRAAPQHEAVEHVPDTHEYEAPVEEEIAEARADVQMEEELASEDFQPTPVEPAKPAIERPRATVEAKPVPPIPSTSAIAAPARPPLASTNRPALAPSTTRPGNGQSFDERFSSDLEAAFNEEEASMAPRTPAHKAPEPRSTAPRRDFGTEVAPPEPPVSAARKRTESMEEEMQRLLDELSGSKPN